MEDKIDSEGLSAKGESDSVVDGIEGKLASIVLANKWQEDEDDGDVKDNWDDEDEEPPKAPEPKKAPTKGAKTKAAKGVVGAEEAGTNAKPLSASEMRQKRLQEEKMQRDSDLSLTKQMLGLEDKDLSLEFPLNTKEDFDLFHKNLVTKLWCYEKNPYYLALLDRLFRDLCVPLDSEEVKNLSSTLNALFNEKVKAQKATTKSKKKTGKSIKLERNPEAMLDNDYGDDLDDIM